MIQRSLVLLNVCLKIRKCTTALLAELKASTISKDLARGKHVHAALIRTGDDSNVSVANSLVNMYVKCGNMSEARSMFEKIHLRTVVSWNVLVLGYAENGQTETVLGLFSRMHLEGCAPDARTFVAVLKACKDLAVKTEKKRLTISRGNVIHLLASIRGCDSELFVASILADLFGKCGNMISARRVFDCVQHCDVALWTALILGYAENGEGASALQLFVQMVRDGCFPNSRTYVACLKACSTLAEEEAGVLIDGRNVKVKSREKGRALQCMIINYVNDTFVDNTLVDMYSTCGSMYEAEIVFERMQNRTVVSWNALILGFADNGEAEEALHRFSRMVREGYAPNARTFVAVLKACAYVASKSRSFRPAGAVHLLASTCGCDGNIFVNNTMMDLCAKCGCIDDSKTVFDAMKHRDVVSWNALITGYADNGKEAMVLELFSRMRREGVEPSALTFSAALKACGSLGALEVGKSVHREINARLWENDVVLGTCLVDFYAKCGSLSEAERIFSSLNSKDLATWNALLAGYSRQGNIGAVFFHFDTMLKIRLRPNTITFLCVLKACSHAGLVEKGKEYFEMMYRTFGINRELEHYTCVIDVLGRAGKLDDAMLLVRSMPVTPDDVTWMAVLGASFKWKNDGIGKLAYESLDVDYRNSGGYVQMASVYNSGMSL